MDYLASTEWLVLNAIQLPMKKNHQVVWDSLLDYGRLDWQHTLQDLNKTLDVAYEDVLRELTRFGVSKASL